MVHPVTKEQTEQSILPQPGGLFVGPATTPIITSCLGVGPGAFWKGPEPGRGALLKALCHSWCPILAPSASRQPLPLKSTKRDHLRATNLFLHHRDRGSSEKKRFQPHQVPSEVLLLIVALYGFSPRFSRGGVNVCYKTRRQQSGPEGSCRSSSQVPITRHQSVEKLSVCL